MAARIYQIQKNALQSGKARTDKWVLEFAPSEAKKADPLTGWAGSGDTQSQVKLTFPSLDAARAYADPGDVTLSITRSVFEERYVAVIGELEITARSA